MVIMCEDDMKTLPLLHKKGSDFNSFAIFHFIETIFVKTWWSFPLIYDYAADEKPKMKHFTEHFYIFDEYRKASVCQHDYIFVFSAQNPKNYKPNTARASFGCSYEAAKASQDTLAPLRVQRDVIWQGKSKIHYFAKLKLFALWKLEKGRATSDTPTWRNYEMIFFKKNNKKKTKNKKKSKFNLL